MFQLFSGSMTEGPQEEFWDVPVAVVKEEEEKENRELFCSLSQIYFNDSLSSSYMFFLVTEPPAEWFMKRLEERETLGIYDKCKNDHVNVYDVERKRLYKKLPKVLVVQHKLFINSKNER